MLKTIGLILIAMVLAMLLTLSAVISMKVVSIEAQVSGLEKIAAEMNLKLAEMTSQAPAGHAAKDAQPHEVHWGYSGDTGPARWGDNFPVCGSGQSQSPLDIRAPFEKSGAKLKFDYKPIPLKVLNNGHTLQVNAAPGSTLQVDGESYALLQFHFHRPSEELIEGKPAAMVAHFVHKNDAGKLVVVGVLLNEGRPNEVIKSVWANAPAKAGPEVEISGSAINPALMLPAKLDYYAYEGSLTTPPCTEGVHFYILKTPAAMSTDQIRAFPFELNARPVMPRNGRKIYAN